MDARACAASITGHAPGGSNAPELWNGVIPYWELLRTALGMVFNHWASPLEPCQGRIEKEVSQRSHSYIASFSIDRLEETQRWVF